MFSCTNALAQTIGALRKQDRHHPNTPDITQTIQALTKQSFPHIHLSFPHIHLSFPHIHLSFPHIHLSFPRRRGSIVGSAIFLVIVRSDWCWESLMRSC